MDKKIDFVIAWVDSNDIKWQNLRNKYASADPEDRAEYRYRDWWTLKYFFRWVEKFTPWVNNVFFVTFGHCPSWLNLNHPKLKFIKHENYIPKEYLPTFNSHTIELNFHRITGLSEHFVYFNDDMFIIDFMKQSDFFELGVPKQIAGLEAITTSNEIYAHTLLNDVLLINRHFSYAEIITKNREKWFYPGYWIKILAKTIFLKNYPNLVWFYVPHLPNPVLKSTMLKLWNDEYEVLNNSSKSRFRTVNNVNQYVFSWYDIANGNFIPRNNDIGHCFTIKGGDNWELVNSIVNQNYKMICINDTEHSFDFEKVRKDVVLAFERLFPEKSWFEK